MNLVEVLEIHAVSGPESGVVASPSASVEGFILSTHLNLGVVAAEVVVEACIDAVVGSPRRHSIATNVIAQCE